MRRLKYAPVLLGCLVLATTACKRSEPKGAASEAPKAASRTGAKAPEFALPDAQGNTVSLQSLLSTGPAVVVFYRGHW